MPFDLTFGLLLVDHEKYAQYRAEMSPLLEAAGGKFRYDFEIARTLKSEAKHDINRVFVIQFPDRATRERFFSNPKFAEIRTRLFDKSVQGMSIIGEYTN